VTSIVDPPGAPKPLPPEELIYRVTGIRDEGPSFLESGRTSALEIEAALVSWNRQLDSFDRILDFGCGCGRILIWLERLAERCELYGADIDADVIEWTAANLPFVQLDRNSRFPPLPYPDAHFDLVLSSSVFTHIDEPSQDLWLAELQRVTKPGGYLLLTVHGERAFRHAQEVGVGSFRSQGPDSARWAETLENHGILFVEDDGWVGGPYPDWYHTTFHAPWYVFARWGRELTIRAFIPRRSLDYQDYVLLERPMPDRPPIQPLAPAVAALSERLALIEHSRSWRLARFLSRLGRPFRRQ
jgi:SAM-dependent methyltransferase